MTGEPTATWPSANEPRRLVVIGNPDSRRVQLLQTALAARHWPPARVAPYAALLNGELPLAECVQAGDFVRIESPGKDFAVERLLLALGAEAAADEPFAHLPHAAAAQLACDKGRILCPRQWYLGFCAALRMIERQLRDCPPHRLLNAPADIALMFDKPRCHALLAATQTPVPRGLGVVASYDELLERMQQTNLRRVFAKLAHGSSASGVVALAINGQQQQALTTVEMTRRDSELRLYNSRRVRCYRDRAEIAALIDELCRHRVHAEQWLPKAGFKGRVFDVRILVIAGRACHAVARLSRSPLTNLHLLNERAEAADIAAHVGTDNWRAALSICERALQCFPASFHAGFDLLFTPGFTRQAVLEVNAFGDLLPEVRWQGLDTYTAQLLALAQTEAQCSTLAQ